MGRKRTKNHYFTKVHEDAIVEYSNTPDIKRKSELYEDFIEPAFSEMVDKIVYTYKFTNLPNVDCLKEDCKNWLTTILDKYDPSKGSKAFSYFSVTTKNWFIHKTKKNSLKIKREINLTDVISDSNDKQTSLVSHNTYLEGRERKEFWNHLWEEITVWEKLKLKENERKVLEAIKILFRESDNIEIFNKKAIYLYIREITGLNTKQVVNNLNKLRSKYRDFKEKWNKNL